MPSCRDSIGRQKQLRRAENPDEVCALQRLLLRHTSSEWRHRASIAWGQTKRNCQSDTG